VRSPCEGSAGAGDGVRRRAERERRGVVVKRVLPDPYQLPPFVDTPPCSGLGSPAGC
jgi:hypothetical protein